MDSVPDQHCCRTPLLHNTPPAGSRIVKGMDRRHTAEQSPPALRYSCPRYKDFRYATNLRESLRKWDKACSQIRVNWGLWCMFRGVSGIHCLDHQVLMHGMTRNIRRQVVRRRKCYLVTAHLPGFYHKGQYGSILYLCAFCACHRHCPWLEPDSRLWRRQYYESTPVRYLYRVMMETSLLTHSDMASCSKTSITPVMVSRHKASRHSIGLMCF